MPKSDFAKNVDWIQSQLHKCCLKLLGFQRKGRTFNRLTDDGLTQVVNLQSGQTYYGQLAMNLGVYVPEVTEVCSGVQPSFVQEYYCSVRERLGSLIDGTDKWWPADGRDATLSEILQSLREHGLPFLERFATRDRILAEWKECATSSAAGHPPRIVLAIILAKRGYFDEARRLLATQVKETKIEAHADYVRQLAAKIGVIKLDS